MEAVDWKQTFARLREMADARGAVEDPNEWRSLKRGRIEGMAVDPDHIRLVLASPACPVAVAHRGSEDAARAAEAFVATPSLRLLVLGGPTGRGKTVTATWIAATLDACRWLSAKDVRVGDAWSQMHPKAMRSAVLIVDDLGHEASEWAHKELSALLESRFDKGLRSVVTTNLPPAAFGKVYGDRLASRMERPGRGLYVVCGGNDLRREAK